MQRWGSELYRQVPTGLSTHIQEPFASQQVSAHHSAKESTGSKQWDRGDAARTELCHAAHTASCSPDMSLNPQQEPAGAWSDGPDGIGCAQCCLQHLQAEGKKDPIQPLGGRAANQHPGEQGRGNSTGLSAATQSLCLPSGSWVNCSMQPQPTRAGLGHLPQSITQHQPAQLPAPSPPRRLHFGGYSCFSSQRGPRSPLQHACLQRDCIQ